ncbi:MAG TPA: tRNA preQ1(34) S-adenosylmethionine ribosyltransferase-isomerase QueA [Candidatus Acidoferrales bacterium]|nr:tRNA preQ1(34) S-adenosylmethionine ribosyltransferase-isomerase QueA [Candidatus Acidoferrales bacterium]
MRAPLLPSDFHFDLPSELIAQTPAERRDAARLLVLNRADDALTHAHVGELPNFLRAGDLLVVNDTRVIPARIFGRSASGGAVELLLVRSVTSAPNERDWLCLGKPARRLRVGAEIAFPDHVRASVVAAHGDGRYTVAFDATVDVSVFLSRHGEIPLPPYIRRPDGPLPLDQTRYQTVFACAPGAIAAPTAGLHFTERLIDLLRARDVDVARLTLHVGPGTFLPVRCEDLHHHVMDPEWCEISEVTATAIRRAKAAGGRVVAVGTTTTRALESAASDEAVVEAGMRWADRFIVPGDRFRVIDALFTNFHLPGSTLLLLVSAFAGRERVLATYIEAVRRRYRFYSYGDAMLIQ